jgi:zinc/manganese transport system ATP-binding protein
VTTEVLTPAASTAAAQKALSIDDVTVRLGGRTVLEHVSFSLTPGEFTGLIGANGAGKTTLFRVILGLQPTTSGSIHLGSGRRSKADIGYVPQKFLLDPDIPLPSKTRRARVDEMVDAVDARDFADARVGRLSGGEQQRILIAHALISRPKLLLLDEPLANLDLRAAQDVVGLLSRIAAEQRIAVLISAHEMNPLLPVMDRIVYLAAGRAASGTVDEVVRSEVLSKLYGHHVDVLRVHGRVIVVAGTGHDEHAPEEHAPDEPADDGPPAVEIV